MSAAQDDRRNPVTLACEDVHVELGGTEILRGIDLTLRSGEVTVLVGPNGAGKSTLFAVLAGDLAPRTGRVRIAADADGRLEDVSSIRPLLLARMRAVQMQDSRLSFAFTARASVEMGRAPWVGTDEEERDDAVVESAMRASETLALAGQQVPVLSGGERARVAFARALAQETGILLLDEPTAALDIRHQERVIATARERAAQGATVLVIVHDLSLAGAYADRIVLLSDGLVVADGSPAEVLDAALLSSVYDYPVTVLNAPGTDERLVVPLRGRAPASPAPSLDTPSSTPLEANA
ncbi:heme ABC transporter ATP-binding protein [Brachybacterium sp. MASK1Z-5]|uniref:Heme ABC transporter ATP-binding protein n=1 Tax=Brachybacterium halotolerans TaxID=2795215 RepID=A0ABS1BDU9_9MICO|nr:heme ABC transporter ATP-binding protein [Brachybacterium halotolerans]MBK0332771.1 heme ABC transporter ATP-binding protein [Brachybacterium halotolerans]